MQKLGADLACQSETYSPDHPFVGWLSCVGKNEEGKLSAQRTFAKISRIYWGHLLVEST